MLTSMRRSRPYLLGLLALLVLVPRAVSAEDEKAGEEEITYYAEDFTLPTHLGGQVKLSEALEKGPVILDFWATWCTPCRRAMPVYAELVEEYGEYGLQLLPVSLDTKRAQKKIGPWFEERGFAFPSLLDPDQDVAQKFNVVTLPTMFLLDSDATLVSWHVGFRPDMKVQLEKEIREILELPAEEAQ